MSARGQLTNFQLNSLDSYNFYSAPALRTSRGGICTPRSTREEGYRVLQAQRRAWAGADSAAVVVVVVVAVNVVLSIARRC